VTALSLIQSPLVGSTPRQDALKAPIRWLPKKNACVETSERTIPVRIEALRHSHVALWQRHVQPLIKRHYRRDDKRSIDSNGIERRVRADADWNWWRILALLRLHNAATILPLNQSGKGFGWAIVPEQSNTSVPIGLVTVVPLFRCSINGVEAHRAFAWYMSDAPEEYFKKFAQPLVEDIAVTLLDTAIQTRADLEEDRSMVLRAAPSGGPRLAKFYEDKCGMRRIANMTTRFSWMRAPIENEYFEFSHEKATQFCRNFDSRRSFTIDSASRKDHEHLATTSH
jgi:hypothetical protein